MLAEIPEQPAALSRTLDACMKTAEELRRRFEKHRPRLVVIVARGTSDNAAITNRYLIEITTGIPVSLAAPSTLTLYGAKVDYRDALVVGISQSGESTDTNALVESARNSGAVTVGVTNEASSALATIAEFVLPCRAGKENSIAATKTYTAQLLSMYLLSYAPGGFIRSDELARVAAVGGARIETRGPDRGDCGTLSIHDPYGHGRARLELRQRAGIRP
jgi:glucosamine--fructose-6-phosphate aminotransferase (isomerizing)